MDFAGDFAYISDEEYEAQEQADMNLDMETDNFNDHFSALPQSNMGSMP